VTTLGAVRPLAAAYVPVGTVYHEQGVDRVPFTDYRRRRRGGVEVPS
jgi:hypothetical protein